MVPTRAQAKARFLNLLDDPTGKVFLVHSGGPTYTVSTGVVSGGVATLTVGTHSMTVGQQITVAGITSSGATMNGPEVTITAKDTLTISYAVVGSPTYVSGGVVQTGSSAFDEAFTEAFDAMFQSFLLGQVPRIKNIVTYTIAPNTSSLTPATAGITDFADYVQVRERLASSSELWRTLESREQLTQRASTDRLLEFVWREDTFYFIPATTSRELEITYESSGTAPTLDATSIGVDGCLTFLANYAVGVAGQRKGYDEIAQRCWVVAVGTQYNNGVIGGELFRITQARVRSEQKTQVAPRPFTTWRRGWPMWRAPYISAPQPTGVAGAPAQFSTADGTITGTINGSNALFYLAYPVGTVAVYVDGVLQTQGSDYTFGANQITFLNIPSSGVITAQGWI